VWLVAAAVLLSGCSATRDLESDATTTTDKPPSSEIDPLDAAALASGAEGVEELQALIDRLLASNDTCAILTQRDVRENRLDPTIFTTSAARRVLAEGLIAVFDHLVRISPPQLRQPLIDQQAVFTEVLEVVEQYANNPADTRATAQINSLVGAPGFVAAQQQINAWVSANCF
jgi:hypothetical protein